MVAIDIELFNMSNVCEDEFYQSLAKPRKLCKDYRVASMYVADLPSLMTILPVVIMI